MPEFRQQGVAKFLLQEIAKRYTKAQSISVLSMPMNLFVDADDCETPENQAYYQALNLATETMEQEALTAFLTQSGFITIAIDDSALDEPLPFKVFIASPQMLV